MIKRICETTLKPKFEVDQWPIEELEFWVACFSINDNQDKPMFKTSPKHVTVEQSISDLVKVLN